MSTAKHGDRVTVHYIGTFNDGREFDNSHKRGNPISFSLGEGKVIKGFEQAVLGLSSKAKTTIKLAPEDAYGPINPDAVIEVEKSRFPEDFVFVKEGFVRSFNKQGRPVFGRITEVKDQSVILDVNHPLAGKELNFEIEVVDVKRSITNEEANQEIINNPAIALGNWNAKMRKTELLSIAKKCGLTTVNTKSTKAQIIEALQEARS